MSSASRNVSTFIYPSDAAGDTVTDTEKTATIGVRGEVIRVRVHRVSGSTGSVNYSLALRPLNSGTEGKVHGALVTWADTDWVAGDVTTAGSNDDTIESAALSIGCASGLELAWAGDVAGDPIRIYVDYYANDGEGAERTRAI